MPRTLSLLAVLKKVDAKGVKSLSNAQWGTFLASDTEPNEIQDKIKKLEGYEEKFAVYDSTGELIVEDNQAMMDRFKEKTGRAKDRESFKVKKTKINVGEFLGKDRTPDKSQNPDISGIFNDEEEKGDVGPKGMESKVGRLSRIVRDTRGRVLKLEEENKKKPSNKLATDGLDETVNLIAEKVISIEDTLKDQIKVDVENKKLQKQKLENEKRDDEESRLGKVTGFLKGAADKIIAPVQNIFGQIFGFIKRLILGKIFLNILKWFGNPANQGKIDGIIKFFGNNWKKLLSLYLVFGTGLGKFVRFLTKVAIKGILKLGILLAKIAAAKGVKGARGFAKMLGGKKGALIAGGLTAVTSLAMYGGVNKMLGGGKEDGEGEEPQKFNKGGKVRGQGDKDTVPAMLTPGEFVMSKGAVQQYGVDTMEAMNAAAGGTNVPVLMPDKKRKGFPGGGRPYAPTAPTMGYGMGQVQPDQFVFNKTEFISKSTTTTRNGEVIDHKREKSMTDIGGNIAVEDMKEHQTQLVESLRKVPGYEKINFMDVMQYPDGKGRLVGMPEETLYPILNSSDAGKASEEKRRAAQEKFLVDNNLIKPDGGVKAYSYYDGKLKVDGETRDAVLEEGAIRQFNSGGLVSNSISNSISNFNGGGLVQYLNNGGKVMSTSENATMQGGKVVSGNMSQSSADYSRKKLELEKAKNLARQIHGFNSPEVNQIKKQLLILDGTPADAIYTDRKGNVKVKGYSTYSGKNQRSISNKSEKNPANFSQPQGSGGGFGLKRMIGGMADIATGHMFDFDKRSGGGLLRKTANTVGKTASGIGKGLKRGVGGAMDQMTGNLFDFDNRSGGGLIRKTANAVGGLFGGSKPSGDKIMAKEPKIKEIKIPSEGLESILIKISSKQDIKTPVGQPSLSGPKITVMQENKSINTPMGGGASGHGKTIPKFNAGYGSVRKMKQLGISR